MKSLLLARPDHSIDLYRCLREIPEIDIQFHTFGVFKKGSLLSKLKPYVKTVDSKVNISYQFTALHRLLHFLPKHLPFDYYKIENKISNYFFRQILLKQNPNVDVIHYWPIYCYQAIREVKNTNPQIKLLADVYAVHPDYALELLESEYDKFGISFKQSHFSKGRERDILSLENTDNIVVPSEYMAQIYRQYLPQTKVFTASFGILKQIRPLTIHQEIRHFQEPLKMVFIGKISIEKGCIYLLEAIKQLPATEFQLDIIGDVEVSQSTIFRQYSYLPNVRFLGKLPNPKILTLLSQYHIFIMPSLTDAYSLAVSEALSQHVPVIVTENVGSKDDVKRFQIGEICKVKCVESLINAILKLYDEGYRQSLKSNIDNFIANDKENNYASKILKIYKIINSNT